jgi:hypothetical protein
MKVSNILIGVVGAVVGAGALYAYNRFIGGAAHADEFIDDDVMDDDVVEEEPASKK